MSSPPTPAAIQQARAFLDRLDVRDISAREALGLMGSTFQENPEVLRTMCQRGAIDLKTFPEKTAGMLFVMVAAGAPELLDGFLDNAIGDRIERLQDVVMTPTLIDGKTRDAYLGFLNRWKATANAWPSQVNEAVSREITTRLSAIVHRHAREGVGESIEEVVMALGETVSPHDVNRVFTESMLDLCKSKVSLIDQHDFSARSGQSLLALIRAGANPHSVSKELDRRSSRISSEDVEHPNLLHQVLYFRSHYGLTPEGVPGERDPVIDALVAGGADWRAAMEAPGTTAAMKETLRQGEIVRRGLLEDLATQKTAVARPRGKI